CAGAVPSGHIAARRLRECLASVSDAGIATAPLETLAGDPLRDTAEQVGRMRAGADAPEPGLGAAEREVYDAGIAGEDFGARVGRGDVVVLHDALTPALAPGLRERGAHVVWSLSYGGGTSAAEAWEFLARHLTAVDAFVVSGPGWVVAVIPAQSEVAAIDAARADDAWGWTGALAEVVQADRGDTVGGRFHARPTVAKH
ncbi:MAG TPA: hypothetical protein VFR49_15520, partial [Solirubrobacteraceae bacterium]|nr:hypothetical protein [Solirubrobacteraceae bacterium]